METLLTRIEPGRIVSGKEAPTPPYDPIFGHLRYVKKDPLGQYVKWMREFGDIVRLRFPNGIVHLLFHPDYVKRALTENAKNYGKDTPGFAKTKRVMGNGLVTSDGEFWRKQRRIAQPAFHRDRIQEFSHVMWRAASDMLETWARTYRDGERIDLHREINRLAMRVVGETLLGDDMGMVGESVTHAVAYLSEDVVIRLTRPFDIPLSIPTRGNTRFVRERALLFDIVDRIIEKRRKSQERPRDLLTLLMDARDDETGERMSDHQLRDEVMTMFLAGHETVSNGLLWTFYCLSANASWRRLLLHELDAVRGGEPLKLEDVGKLKLVDRAIKESMRLYPPISHIGRRVKDDDEIGGYHIPAGSLIAVSPFAVHRNPAFWENPEGFDPDRFLPERESQRPKHAYLPFGAGPRMCIGGAFAMLEMQIIVGLVSSTYELDLASDQKVQPEHHFALRPKFGMTMTLRTRG